MLLILQWLVLQFAIGRQSSSEENSCGWSTTGARETKRTATDTEISVPTSVGKRRKLEGQQG